MGTAKLGMKTVFQGNTGRDVYGSFIRNELNKAGIDGQLLTDSDCPTGISISFTGEDERCFVTYPGTNAILQLDQLNIPAVQRARHIHLTGYDGIQNHEAFLSTLQQIHQLEHVSVSMDVGWDSTGTWTERIFELMPFIDIMLMNETECLHYTRCNTPEKGAARIADHAAVAVVKLGAHGSLACRGSHLIHAAAFPVTAVDTTGAGDSFNAGFVAGWLEGRNLSECLMVANACGAMSVTAIGGNTAFPLPRQLNAFLEQNRCNLRWKDASE